MKYFKTILLICVFYFNSYSQDEFIDKYSNRISDITLKIKSISKDSLTYKAFRKTYIIPLSGLYCYRYKNGYWIYPDTSIKGTVIKGMFVFNTPEYKKPAFILKPFYYGTSTSLIDFRQEYKIIFTKDSAKTITLKKNRQISFELNTDTLNGQFICNLYKIIKDTIVVSGYFGGGKVKKYWKIPMDEVSYIDFQTDGQKALKITSSVLLSAVSFGIAGMAGGVGGVVLPGLKLQKKNDLKSTVKYEFVKVRDEEQY